MFDLFSNINVDWMGIRKPLIAVSIFVLLAGLTSAVVRQAVPGGTEAFNLGVDFQGGTVITAKFKGQKPSDDQIRQALQAVDLNEAVIQSSLDKTDEYLIKVPLIAGENVQLTPTQQKVVQEYSAKSGQTAGSVEANTNAQANSNSQANPETGNEMETQVDPGRILVKAALDSFGKEAAAATSLEQDANATYKIVGTDSVGTRRRASS